MSRTCLVFVRGQSEGESYLLSDAGREEFMGVPCIKGTYRPTRASTHWMSGQVIYVPLDKVLLVAEYESFEAYCQALQRHYAQRSK